MDGRPPANCGISGGFQPYGAVPTEAFDPYTQERVVLAGVISAIIIGLIIGVFVWHSQRRLNEKMDEITRLNTVLIQGLEEAGLIDFAGSIDEIAGQAVDTSPVRTKRSAPRPAKPIVVTQSTSTQSTQSATQSGTVKWFSPRKGFGFIAPAQEGEEDVFIHQSDLTDSGLQRLHKGERVTFSVIQEERGPRAVNVERVGSEA